MLRSCLLMATAIGLTACGKDREPPISPDTVDQRSPGLSPTPRPGDPVTPVPPPPPRERPANEIARFYHSGMNERQRSVITDAATWSAVWQQVTRLQGPPPPVPAVDFANEVVVLASMGSKRSGGYSIDITSAAVSDGRLRVVVLETSPGPQCGVTAALTAPVHIVRAPRTNSPAVFIEQATTRHC